jgi:26S proteasome regulatory subunit N9
MRFFDDPLSVPYRVDVFERFVSDFENRINQLRLVEMGVKVSKDIDSAYFASITSLLTHQASDIDPQIHLSFLTSLLSRIESYSAPSTTPSASASFPVSKLQQQEAHVLLLATIAHAKLVYGDVEGTKTDMDAAWKVLDTLEGVDNGVNAAYYGVAADYYKVQYFFGWR